MGGAIAQMLAIEHAAAVAGLILIGTGGRLRIHPDILSLMGSSDRYPEAVETIVAWSFSPSADTRMVELAGARMRQVAPKAVEADFIACDQFDILARLGEISCPTLVICGSEDRLTPPKYSHYLNDSIPTSSFVAVEHAGHMVMLEQPEQVGESILGFMRQFD
jgi:pimeloyl-ACP methyl ester carboxylesterase